MTSQLELYNIAMRYLGNPRLSSTSGLSENRADRKELDAVYEKAVEDSLEQAIWYYAVRTIHITYDTGITPAFGFAYAYPWPDDMKLLHKISPDEFQRGEVLEFKNENKVIRCELPELYLSYVSNGDDYGWDLGKMGGLQAEYIGCLMAYRSNLPVTGDKSSRADLYQLTGKTLNDAKVREAVDQRIKTQPLGRWSTSRGRGVSTVHIRNGRIGWRG